MTLSIKQAADQYITIVRDARSVNTYKTYENGISLFIQMLDDTDENWSQSDVSGISEDAIAIFIRSLKNHMASTERLYLSAVTGFYEYLAAEKLADINLPRVHLLIKTRARIPGQRLPQFPKDAIKKIVDHLVGLKQDLNQDMEERLRILRDRAFLVSLADTGMRVHEACNLKRGDIDYEEGKALIIGKGNRQAVIRFSKRSQQAIDDYLKLRAQLDGGSGKPLSSLPLFARHDKGAGKKVKPITTTTGRNIVSEWVKQILGSEFAGRVTPHSFRHYFVTRVLQGTGNLKMAQELARHKSIAVTQRYAHLNDDELDKGYFEVFEDK